MCTEATSCARQVSIWCTSAHVIDRRWCARDLPGTQPRVAGCFNRSAPRSPEQNILLSLGLYPHLHNERTKAQHYCLEPTHPFAKVHRYEHLSQPRGRCSPALRLAGEQTFVLYSSPPKLAAELLARVAPHQCRCSCTWTWPGRWHRYPAPGFIQMARRSARVGTQEDRAIITKR